MKPYNTMAQRNNYSWLFVKLKIHVQGRGAVWYITVRADKNQHSISTYDTTRFHINRTFSKRRKLTLKLALKTCKPTHTMIKCRIHFPNAIGQEQCHCSKDQALKEVTAVGKLY